MFRIVFRKILDSAVGTSSGLAEDDTVGVDTKGVDTKGVDTEGVDTEGVDAEGIDAEGVDTEEVDTLIWECIPAEYMQGPA